MWSSALQLQQDGGTTLIAPQIGLQRNRDFVSLRRPNRVVHGGFKITEEVLQQPGILTLALPSEPARRAWQL